MPSANNPFFQPAKITTPKSTTTTATSSPSTASPTKRPCIRVKRPKNYNDKSTITQTTEAVTQQNAFNSILDEADNLCQAAAEAQQLGRLQMASTYLLLLHARLVGLGKRFDKAYQNNSSLTTKDTTVARKASVSANPVKEQTTTLPKQLDFGPIQESVPKKSALHKDSSKPKADAPAKLITVTQEPEHQDTTSDVSQMLDSAPNSFMFSPSTSNDTYPKKQQEMMNATPKTAAARQLASMLPQNIELDSAMMEHLAKAAAELHAARSNRKRPRSDATPQLFASVQPSMPSDRVVDWELPGVDRAVRKPATAAMNTVPNANCNLKRLLQGDPLEKPNSSDGK
ncbi:hypothetical protein FisN_23Lh057 [Fistulifera solaris]|uniref:Uncharacterized protein n=1 Tax=Fistulifera solaris TaxID=1519565 RepID=A0A1Z5KJR8_FISSO|nr:hypothetical protein FisN_23Lh057 [Fistulifera solaris]|eukprot:GAX26529.1 hypothetical protein FisN_23Lh057 [Fistulifera solaris]